MSRTADRNWGHNRAVSLMYFQYHFWRQCQQTQKGLGHVQNNISATSSLQRVQCRTDFGLNPSLLSH